MIPVESLLLSEIFKANMPTLTRLLFAIVVLIALIYGAMVGLVYLVKPVTTDITIDIAPENIHLRDRPQSRQPNVQQPVDMEAIQNSSAPTVKGDGK